MTTVFDLDQDRFTLIQTDTEIKGILEYCGLETQNWSYLFVELDKSQADIKRVYGADNCNLNSTAFLIYTTEFNK